MSYRVAAIDIHKKLLMVVVATAASEVEDPAGEAVTFECRRFGTGNQERGRLVSWLQQHGVTEVVMESTAQYWKPIWLDLEPAIPKLHLAQAYSNRAPKLAKLGDERLQCSEEELIDALRGTPTPTHLAVLQLYLERLDVLDRQIQTLDKLVAQELKEHQDAVTRVAEIPGFGADSAQQIIAEIGVEAETFPSAGEFSSWAGVCPGSNVTAEQNQSSRSAKGNRFVRRILTEAAQAAVKKKGCHFQSVFRRLLPRLGYDGAIWAVAHRLARVVWKILHDRVRYIEQGSEGTPQQRSWPKPCGNWATP
jgi:hypothetical protein